MTIDHKIFLDTVRLHPFGGSLAQGQVEGMTRIIDEWERRKLTDLRWLAYMIATSFHETWYEMQPIRERGSESYLRSKRYWPWVGEGLVQTTWEENAKKFGAKKPGDLLTWPCALRGLFDGMMGGMFTGRALKHYFGTGKDDPVGARRIINGEDQAHLIASYHYAFLHALTLATHPVAVQVAVDKPHPALAA